MEFFEDLLEEGLFLLPEQGAGCGLWVCGGKWKKGTSDERLLKSQEFLDRILREED